MWTGQGCICELADLEPDLVNQTSRDYDNPTFADSGHTQDCEASDGCCNDPRCKGWD